jgi:two-component system, NtrC family, sensor kinase
MRSRSPGIFARGINNLQVKATLFFLLALMIPLGLVSAFAIRTADELILNLVSSQLEGVADDKLNLLERWLAERRADVRVVADSATIRSMDPAAIASYLDLVGVNYEVYRDFQVVSREGRSVLDPTGAVSDYTAEPWFQEAMAGRVYQSGIQIEPGSRESVFHLSMPVRDGPQIQGAVRATVGTGAILSAVLRVSLGKTGEVYLVDDKGVFLAHRDPRKILADNIARSGSFENIFRPSRHRIFYTDYRGIEVLGASRHVGGTDWHLVVEQDRAEAFATVTRLKRVVYAAVFGSVLVTVVLARLLVWYIVKPIQDLSGAAEALARGEFRDESLRTGRGDEIGALFTAFGDMARRLQARQSSLEEKVELTAAELKETDVKLKKTEEVAARSERLAALGRLAAGVTHEIRTPLTSLKLFLQSVKEDVEISPESVEDYRIAMTQILRIEATINRFLDFAKPQDPIRATLAVGAVIEEALEVVGPRATEQEISVLKKIDPDLPRLSGDRKQLGEMLINLMVNALEAMGKGDALVVSAVRERRRLRDREQDCVRISVTDTGEGIDPANLERLFDPFFTTKSAGTGLGLSIVNSTVIRHGGEVTVESRPGAGATFRIYLPAAEQPEEEKT